MTDRQVNAVKLVIYLAFVTIYVAALASVAFPDLGRRAERGRQWFHYYRWLSTRLPLPRWLGALERDDLPDELVPL